MQQLTPAQIANRCDGVIDSINVYMAAIWKSSDNPNGYSFRKLGFFNVDCPMEFYCHYMSKFDARCCELLDAYAQQKSKSNSVLEVAQ